MPFNEIKGGKGGWDQPPPSVDEILEKAGNFFKGGSLFILLLVIGLGFFDMWLNLRKLKKLETENQTSD